MNTIVSRHYGMDIGPLVNPHQVEILGLAFAPRIGELVACRPLVRDHSTYPGQLSQTAIVAYRLLRLFAVHTAPGP